MKWAGIAIVIVQTLYGAISWKGPAALSPAQGGKRPSKATSRSPSPQITTPEPGAPVQRDRVSAALAPVMPYWNKLQGFLAHGDWILAKLRFTLSPRYERWFGPNALLWIAILSIILIIYVGFGLTVSVTGFGWPRNLLPWIDNDYWWHLATGNWIIDNEMPSPDPLSLPTMESSWPTNGWARSSSRSPTASATTRPGSSPPG